MEQNTEKARQRQLETREAYLVKRRSLPDPNVSPFTFHEQRVWPF